MSLSSFDQQQLSSLQKSVRAEYDQLRARKLDVDMTRGNPSPRQFDLSNGLLTVLADDEFRSRDGVDCRNYGVAEGLPELRDIFSELLHIPTPQLIAGGNSSLAMMYQTVHFAMQFGVSEGSVPWARRRVKCLCPVPGYDRHFAIMAAQGIELVPVPLAEDGPDMAEVRRLVASDPDIVAMWMVPVYSNPTGTTYSEQRISELVTMPTAADDFRIFSDNAYALHHLTDDCAPVVDILGLAAGAGNPDRVFTFASTSKFTMPGAGIAFWGSSPRNVEWFLGHMTSVTIGPDKINQLRHARFFGNADGVRAHLRAHAAIITPRFEIVHRTLAARLGTYDIARWTSPHGGYFISLHVLSGTARRVTELAGAAGIRLLPAGASFPHGHDPDDSHLRIAPTFPPERDVEIAVNVLGTSVLLAAVEALLDRRRRPHAARPERLAGPIARQ